MQFWTDQKLILSFYHHCTRPVCERFELTQAEFDILMFLTNNPEYDTAADIVRIRLLTKSHVSMAIKNLKKRGYPQKLIEARLHQMVDMTFKSLEEIRMQTVVESIIQGALRND